MPDLPTNGYALPEYPFSVPPELLERKRYHHAVVIVGGGLTGLTLACRLAQLRIPAVLLDEDNTVGVKGASSRGICYTQQSLEIFQKFFNAWAFMNALPPKVLLGKWVEPSLATTRCSLLTCVKKASFLSANNHPSPISSSFI